MLTWSMTVQSVWLWFCSALFSLQTSLCWMCCSHVKPSDQKLSRNMMPTEGTKAQSSFWIHLGLASFDYGQTQENVPNPLCLSWFPGMLSDTTLGRNTEKEISKERKKKTISLNSIVRKAGEAKAMLTVWGTLCETFPGSHQVKAGTVHSFSEHHLW